jgi:hypothetical protein
MVEEEIFDYYEVVQFIWTFYREGERARGGGRMTDNKGEENK